MEFVLLALQFVGVVTSLYVLVIVRGIRKDLTNLNRSVGKPLFVSPKRNKHGLMRSSHYPSFEQYRGDTRIDFPWLATMTIDTNDFLIEEGLRYMRECMPGNNEAAVLMRFIVADCYNVNSVNKPFEIKNQLIRISHYYTGFERVVISGSKFIIHIHRGEINVRAA